MTNANDPINHHLTYNQTTYDANGETEGLTKREYMATQLMSGILASFIEKAAIGRWSEELTEVAVVATIAADELIKALNNQ